jgi:hypothetical protein
MRIQRGVRNSMSDREPENGRTCSGLGVQRQSLPIRAPTHLGMASLAPHQAKNCSSTGATAPSTQQSTEQRALTSSPKQRQTTSTWTTLERPTKKDTQTTHYKTYNLMSINDPVSKKNYPKSLRYKTTHTTLSIRLKGHHRKSGTTPTARLRSENNHEALPTTPTKESNTYIQIPSQQPRSNQKQAPACS